MSANWKQATRRALETAPFTLLMRLYGLAYGVAHRGKLRRYIAEHSVRKLQIGGGQLILPGWLNTDFVRRRPEVVFLDATKRFPIPEATFDCVFSEHLIEHLSFNDGLNMLKESRRILKPGGRIRIASPNLQFVIQLYNPAKTEAQQRYIQWTIDNWIPPGAWASEVFVINNYFRCWGHQFIYDFPTLRRSLELAGFQEVIQCEIGQSAHPDLRGLEHHAQSVGAEFDRLETFVVEAARP